MAMLWRGTHKFRGDIIQLSGKALIQGMNAFPKLTVTTKTSAAGYTISAAELIGGMISDTTSTGAIAATLPLVTDVVAAIPSYVVGTSFYFIYRNPGTQTVTITTNTGWTIVGTATIATLNAKLFVVRITSATTATIYSIGTFVC
jgi:hypothetical protein